MSRMRPRGATQIAAASDIRRALKAREMDVAHGHALTEDACRAFSAARAQVNRALEPERDAAPEFLPRRA